MRPAWLAARWRSLRRHPEAGSGGGMSLFLVISVLALIVVTGLVYDGGAKAQALDRATRIASEAARAGLQAAPPGSIMPSNSAARSAVAQYIQVENGAGPNQERVAVVSLTVTGTEVAVDVSITGDTSFLSLIGVDTYQVTGHGTAQVLFN